MMSDEKYILKSDWGQEELDRWPIPRWGDAWKALDRVLLVLKLQADVLPAGHESKEE